jgi:hypothetical protein
MHTSDLRIALAAALVGVALPFLHCAGAAEASAAQAGTACGDTGVHTRHAIALDGVQRAYTATAGTLRAGLEENDAEASMSFVSYRNRTVKLRRGDRSRSLRPGSSAADCP